MNSFYCRIIFLLFLLLPFYLTVRHSSAAEGWPGCPDLTKFIEGTDSEHKSWKDLYRLFKTYQGCDDGVYAEGYSDFVARSLAKHWDHFEELVALVANDPAFHDFILRHIDATAAQGDITALLGNARTRCPSNSVLFCKEIEKAALSALDWFKK
jgi:hypothetical protein